MATSRRSLVLDELGGPPLEVRQLAEEDRKPGQLLAHELRCLCNSLERTGGPGGYVINQHRGSWRYLRDVAEQSVLHVVRLVERSFPGWRLPEGDDIFERVERFLMGAGS